MATRVRWLGHSGLLIETDGHKILVDPFLTSNPKAAMQADEAQADFIFITHGHFDHVGDAIPIAQRTGAMVVANYEIAGWLEKQGLTKVHGMQHGGAFGFAFGRVKFTLAFHGSVLPDGTYGGNPAGFIFYFKDGTKIYNAGDTGLFGDMKLIGEEGIDLAILPIGDNYTMGPDDALRAVQFIQPKKVVPVHFNTFDIINQDAAAWAKRVSEKTSAKAEVWQPGGWVSV